MEVRLAGRNLLTTHPSEAYPGLIVWRGAGWALGVIVPDDGQVIEARGGEQTYAYDTVDGGHAEGFELRPGDRAILARSGLRHALVEWRIERASAGL